MRIEPSRGASCIVFAMSCTLVGAPLSAAQLPVVCVAGSCGTSASSFVGAGQATATSVGNTLTVLQTSEQAILNWSSFNISSDGKVIFKQPDSSAIALNRIFQASPSQIFGLLQSNGQVYLVNQNGIVFGSTAQINVGGLLASTLALNGPLSGGLLGPVQAGVPAPALVSDGRASVIDASGNPVLGTDGKPLAVQILVQQGASINAAEGGRVILAGQSVSNAGSITATDGQVILAAGQSVWIQASTDPSLRGLVVEVDSGGLAENQVQGSISVGEGNASMVGLAVNQQGKISATTSVSENGSIRLLARDTVNVSGSQSGSNVLLPARGGTLTIGSQSVTSVLPDTASTATAIDAQAQPQSVITLAGQTVDLSGGSKVIAPGGLVSISASSDPSAPASSATPDPAAHLRIDSGATIDVSGSSVSVPVTRNLVSVQLRGSELADSPLQRNGPLRGQTVVVDARVGTPLADVSGDIALIQRGVLERTSKGGSVVLDSSGDVVVASGATINVSGGQVNYTPGIMQTSALLRPDGSTVDIGSANPNEPYVGVINPVFEQISDSFGIIQFIPTPGIAHYDPGYLQGSSAGTVQVSGSSLVLNGNFLGNAVNGIYQRSGAGVASGGTFIIGGIAAGSNPAAPDYRAPAVQLVNQVPPTSVDGSASLPSDLPLELSTSLLSSGGFTHLQVSSNDRISVGSGVNLNVGPGGSVSFTAPQIDVAGSISIPAGSVQLTSTSSISSGLGGASQGIFIGDGARFNVSGMWTNDTLGPTDITPSGLALSNAGSISLEQNVFQGTLSLGTDVALLANGGAQLPRTGSVVGGTGGSIAIVGSPGGTVQVGSGDVVQGFGVQGAKGGSFTLEVPRLAISSGDSTWLRAQSVDSDPNSTGVFAVDSSLFSNFGFSSFTLTADGPAVAGGASQDVLTVAPGTNIDLRTSTLMLNAASAQQASGASLADIATATLLPQYQRAGSQLTLQAVPGEITSSQIGNFTVGSGATITADPGSTITLGSVGKLTFGGTINSPSSVVNLEILKPAASLDPGYVPALALELTSTAAINVAGTAVYQPTNNGLLTGEVLAGGTVNLNAARGSVVTDAGSTIDFSGTQAPIDLLSPAAGTSGAQRETVASAAGTLSIASPVSISLLGSYDGQAGIGTTGLADGGTLNLTLSRLLAPVGSGPAVPAVITVQPGALSGALSPQSGIAVLGASQLTQSGVDALNLVADDGVQFTNGVQLNLARSFTATTPAIQVASQAPVSVTAPYIALGNASSGTSAAPALPGGGSIAFNAGEIVLAGSLAFQGAANVSLVSTGDIQLRGELTDANNTGSLSVAGTLTLDAARVVPTTAVNYTITAAGGQNNTVQFAQNGASTGVPLSVDGSLTVNADNIVQGGTVFAPFGQLTFNAADSLNFAPGSLTSVSGTSAILPYGEVQNGTSWVYQVSQSQLGPAPVTALPNRQVTANGARVTLSAGANIDVSGGGDLSAYQFTPGTGGTTDVLSNSVTPGLYAVLPSLAGQAAPFDPMMWAGSNLTANESVYLSGGGGLAAGTYALLPARYALLPGAYLVSVASGFQDLRPGTSVQAGNGYSIVSGYFTNGTTGIGDTRTSGFLIEPGSYASTLANYGTVSASSFFGAALASAAAPPPPLSSPLPADAGTLVVNVQNSFSALGKVSGAGATGGEGATVEIVAPQLIVDPSATTASSAPGVVHLGSDVIDSWNAGRLWLGLQADATGAATVSTTTVEISAGSRLSADEIVLGALNGVQVDSGASLQTTSALNNALTPKSATSDPTALSLNAASAGAALLAVSDLNYWVPTRAVNANAGDASLNIEAGSSVATRGALTLDAPAGGLLADGVLSGTGARWSVGSDNLTFGPQGSAVSGFSIDTALTAALQSAGSLRLSSVAPIELLEPVSFGNGAGAALTELDIFAPGISTSGSASSTFTAGLITLSGSAGAAPVAQPGAGSITFLAQQIDIGPGNLALSGFSSATLDASSGIVGEGNGSLSSAGAVQLLTPLLTTVSGAQTAIAAGGDITLAASARAGSGVAPTLQTGGSLSLSGANLTDSTQILMPSGEVALSSAGQLTVANGASIDVSGVLPANAAHGSDGGSIAFSAGGNLTVASGASLSVGAGQGADAGAISMLAGGTADVEAQLAASSTTGHRSGSFTLQAASLSGFGALNDALELGGFHDTRSIEVGSGDLDLAAGSSITAQNIVLTADSGAITIGGALNASTAAGGGSIVLSSRGDLTLASTATVQANGSATLLGGQIELASTAGTVRLDGAAQVAALGSGNSGSLLVRAPTLGGDDVGIASLPANLSNIGLVILEPIITAAVTGAPGAGDFAAIQTTLANTMAGVQPTVTSRLGLGGAANVVVRPYADITSAGDLTLSGIDFSTWRFNGQPADISIRAGGSLTVNGTVSDGFSNSAGFLDVMDSPSARISLVAGANFNSASATAVTQGAAADLTLSAGSIVRTGTGALSLTAAEDVVFGNNASVYTGGLQGAPSMGRTDTGAPVSFATQGGNVVVTAGRDVLGAAVTEAVDQWNPRFQAPNGSAIWGIDFQEFQWNIGALGGGNVFISAGRNAVDVSAAVADSRAFAGSTAVQLGGGNLNVATGGDVGSGLFYVGNGVGRINAGGALSSTLTDSSNHPIGTLLLAGDASFSISAQRDLLLQGILSATALAPGSNSDQLFFFRYDPSSSLSLQSRGGSVTYNSNPGSDYTFIGFTGPTQSDPFVFAATPPTLDIAAFGSDVIVQSFIQALPSASGQLSIYAARDITSAGDSVSLIDQSPSLLPTAASPSQFSTVSFQSGLLYTGASLHQDDPTPVVIAAGRDISNIEFDLPKSADISAGRDILSMSLAGQNLNPGDITSVRAGRNIVYSDSDTTRFISLTGPGQLEVIAGGNIDLGLSQGITTYGNILNANLASSTGASITVLAGLGAPIGVGGAASSTDFLSTVVAPSAANQTQLVNYVQQVTGQANLSFATAESDFRNLPIGQQLPLIDSVFFSSLVLSGEEANQVPSLGFNRGYAAIDSLFPGSRGSSSAYSGNLTLGYSRIYTLDGGSITLLVPGGNINVGLANPPTDFSIFGVTRQPSDLGIVAVGSGDVNIYSLNDVLVNQSRVFTLGGGNISIWSTLGNIDAGNGAKTSISAPPPTIQVDANGNVTLDFGAAIAGSGIRTIQSEPGVDAGDVNLIAPVGFVNAGDAGIGSAGNINIAAQRVIGATNINFGGTATGVPPEVSGIGAALSAASSVANSATTSATNSVDNSASQSSATAPLAAAALGWLDVFVEGFGEDVCKPNDIECLKRNHRTP